QRQRLARHLQEPRRADLRPGRRSPGRRHTLAVRQPPGRSGLPRERHVEGTLVAAPPGVRGRHRVCDHAGGRTQAGLHFQSQGRGDRHADQRRFQRVRQGSAGARWNRLLSQVRGSGSGLLLGARPQRWEVAAFTLGSLAALATGLLATVLNDRRLLLLIVVAAAVLFAGYAITAYLRPALGLALGLMALYSPTFNYTYLYTHEFSGGHIRAGISALVMAALFLGTLAPRRPGGDRPLHGFCHRRGPLLHARGLLPLAFRPQWRQDPRPPPG